MVSVTISTHPVEKSGFLRSSSIYLLFNKIFCPNTNESKRFIAQDMKGRSSPVRDLTKKWKTSDDLVRLLSTSYCPIYVSVIIADSWWNPLLTVDT